MKSNDQDSADMMLSEEELETWTPFKTGSDCQTEEGTGEIEMGTKGLNLEPDKEVKWLDIEEVKEIIGTRGIP